MPNLYHALCNATRERYAETVRNPTEHRRALTTLNRTTGCFTVAKHYSASLNLTFAPPTPKPNATAPYRAPPLPSITKQNFAFAKCQLTTRNSTDALLNNASPMHYKTKHRFAFAPPSPD